MPRSREPSCPIRPCRGFTVAELFVVILVMSILLGISINVGSGMVRQAMVARARSELAAISQALTLFKMQYGDYPQTDEATVLFDALTGKIGPGIEHKTLDPIGRTFLVNLSYFTVTHREDLSSDNRGKNALLDPWGNPYYYIYKVPQEGWLNPSFVLFSYGPDGESNLKPDNKGRLGDSATTGANADNLYEPALQ